MVQPTATISPPHDFPLLLSKEEMSNPAIVFRDYFESSTLPETRTALKAWLDNALGNQFANGKDLVALYDDMQKLAEAAWLITKDKIPEAIAAPDYDTRFVKSHRLIDQVPEDAEGVVNRIFNDISLFDLRLYLWNCLQLVLSNDESEYHEGPERANAMIFYNDLLLLVEALSVWTNLSQPDAAKVPDGIHSAGEEANKPVMLTWEQATSPETVISDFCKKYSPHFVKTELWDWLNAAVAHPGPFPEGLDLAQIMLVYEFARCLTEAAR